MGDAKSYLAEWLTQFLRSRDAVFRTLSSIDSVKGHPGELVVRYRDKEQLALCCEPFDKSVLDRIGSDQAGLDVAGSDRAESDQGTERGGKGFILVGFNTLENFQFIVDNWEALVSCAGLMVYMVNPVSETEKRWVINPRVHERICDPESLKTGLRTMFETVEVLTQHRIKSLIRHKG
jgi:hypothetical protein